MASDGAHLSPETCTVYDLQHMLNHFSIDVMVQCLGPCRCQQFIAAPALADRFPSGNAMNYASLPLSAPRSAGQTKKELGKLLRLLRSGARRLWPGAESAATETAGK